MSPTDHSLALQFMNQLMDANQGVSAGVIIHYQYTAIVAASTCCSSAFSNATTEGSSETPGKVDSCLISSFSKAAIQKAHQHSFRSLKYPLQRCLQGRCIEPLGQSQRGVFATHSQLDLIQSSTQTDLVISHYSRNTGGFYFFVI